MARRNAAARLVRKTHAHKSLRILSASDQLFQTTDNLLRAECVVRKVIGCVMFDVIRTLKENHKFYAGYTQHLPIKPR
jgi:hypothetical protein